MQAAEGSAFCFSFLQALQLYTILSTFVRLCFTNVLLYMALIITIKPVVIKAQQRSDGSYNLKIRVTFKRKYRILSTNLTAYPKDLARSGEIKGAVLLDANRLVEKMYSAVADLNWFEMDMMDVDDVVRHIRTTLRSRTAFSLDFFQYAKRFMASRKESTAVTYRTALASFSKFLGRDCFDINEFSVPLLKNYVNYLDSTPKGNRNGETSQARKKGVSARSYTRKLSAIYTDAMDEYNDEDSGVIRIKGNPFKKLKVDALPSVAKISKSPEFIQKLIDAVADPATRENQRWALEIYLISFALMGANTADMVPMGKADKGVVTYCRAKTRDRRADNAEMRVRVEPCVEALLARHADPSGRLLLDLHGKYSSVSSLNATLRTLFTSWAEAHDESPFTIYSARHSWATIGRSNRVGLSKSLIDECLGHSTNQLVDVYAEKDWSILWEANKKVLDIFDWKSIK